MTGLEIVVDELIVRGLSPSAAREVSTALEMRLTALAEAAGGDAVRERAEAFRRLPAIEVAAEAPSGLGNALAETVWGAISGGGVR
jgi:hypothetical protein